MRRLLLFGLTVFGVACVGATEPPAFTLGPGCTWVLPIRDAATLRVGYADCAAHNVDSLEAVGWEIVWDTTWAGIR